MTRPLRLLVDARFTRLDHPDGISRFTAGLVGALARRPDRVRVAMLVRDERQLALLPDVPHVMGPSPLRPTEAFVAFRLRRLAPDVVFCPMQTMGSWGRRYGLVLTLHDLIYYAHPTPPGFLPAPVRLAWRLFHRAYWPQRVLLDRADVVATVSATTRELMARHRLTRRPVAVVGNAPTPGAFDAVPVPAPLAPRPGGRLVYMGAFAAYKNVETLVAAMAHLPGHELRLLSRVDPRRRAQLAALAARVAPGAAVTFVDGVNDEEYAAELDVATALLTLSRAEGYGLPLVEAMGRGVPVVAADTPIFREVAGDAATYVPADDPVACARAVRDLGDPAVWRDASDRALARAAAFSWDASAAALLDVADGIVRAREAGSAAEDPAGSPSGRLQSRAPRDPGPTLGRRIRSRPLRSPSRR